MSIFNCEDRCQWKIDIDGRKNTKFDLARFTRLGCSLSVVNCARIGLQLNVADLISIGCVLRAQSFIFVGLIVPIAKTVNFMDSVSINKEVIVGFAMTMRIDVGATVSVKTQLRSYGTLSVSEANVCVDRICLSTATCGYTKVQAF
jgi:hypothetical protein